MYLRVQGFNSYDGAINVPGSVEQVTDTSAAAAVFIEKAAAQVCTYVHVCVCVEVNFIEIFCSKLFVLYCTVCAVLLKIICILTYFSIMLTIFQLVDLMVAGGQSDAQNGGIRGISKIGLDPTRLTPLQRLVLEEVGKILGAGARRTFSNVKESTGRLPTGRTLLGTFMDPLGIFSTSNLIETDDADERTLEAAGKLLEIVQNANGSGKAPATILQDITPADARKLAASVSRRLWDERAELAILTGHLAYVMLRQTARRLEKPKVVKKGKKQEQNADVLADTGIVTLTSNAPLKL